MLGHDNKHHKSVSFIRHYHGYTGGHQKVRDYIQHFLDLNWQTNLFVDGQSATMPNLFEQIPAVNYQKIYDPGDSDLVFLAGMDWQDFLPLGPSNKPVINLIQHVRHADPENPLFQFLSQPAVRVCVSKSVKQAILPHANGPVHFIPMGHKIAAEPLKKSNDLYILANKQPELGRRLAHYFAEQNVSVICHDRYVEKLAVLSAMASSRVSLTLPHHTEGFYLPGIEAMALSDIAIVPDCVASIEYSKHYSNALRCALEFESIMRTTKRALQLAHSTAQLWLRKQRGKALLAKYSLITEKQNLQKVITAE